MARPLEQVIEIAMQIYNERASHAYFYSANGQILDYINMNTMMNNYPTHFARYTQDQIETILAWSNGKRGYDCSSYLGKCIGIPHYSANGLFGQCTEIPLDKLVVGAILWKNGHVGIYIGDDYFLHFPIEMHTCEMLIFSDYQRGISNTPFTKAGLHRDIIYPKPDTKTKSFFDFWRRYIMFT